MPVNGGRKIGQLSMTPQETGLTVPPFSILEEIFKDAESLMKSGIIQALDSKNTKIVQNMNEPNKPLIVIFMEKGMVQCQQFCPRYAAYQICQHSVSVAESEGLLKKFIEKLKKN